MRAVVVGLVAVVMLPAMLWAQDDPHAGMQHDMAAAGWTFMQDGLVFAMYNDQGSGRGERGRVRLRETHRTATTVRGRRAITARWFSHRC